MDTDSVKYYRSATQTISNKEQYEFFENILFPNSNKCMSCNSSIYYYNTKIKYSKNGFFYRSGKSCESQKNINGTNYFLNICEDCLNKKFSNKSFNKNRIFNTVNEITKFAYNISSVDAELHNKSKAVTLDNLVKKYGEEIGKQKFDNYKEKCAETNTFEYKKKTYNWNRNDFETYNKSRAVTLDNLVKKYGEEIGKQKFDIYKEKQKTNGNSIEWFIKKYGEEIGKQKFDNMRKLKINTLDNFIFRYGKIKGEIKYKEYMQKRITNSNYSKKSQIFFKKIDIAISKYNLTTYYGSKNTEYGKQLKNFGYVYLDFYIKELNLCIEYNGNIWHANPEFFNANDTPNFYSKTLTAKDIWAKDSLRYKSLKDEHNIDTIVVWESNENIENVVKLIIEKMETTK